MNELIRLLETSGLLTDQLRADYELMEDLDFEESMVCNFLERVENVVNSLLDRDGYLVDKIFYCISKIRGEL